VADRVERRLTSELATIITSAVACGTSLSGLREGPVCGLRHATVIEATSFPNYARVSVAASVPRSPYAKVSAVSIGTSTAPQYEPVVTIMPAGSGVPPIAR
jgi:hypothetical protein